MNDIQIKNPLLSIIIPAYNTQQYLDNLVWILKNQINKNNIDKVEIVIVDGTEGINSDLSQYYKFNYKNYPIRYYHIKNRTAGCSRNYGIEHSSGEYICFVDSDDKVSDSYIEKILNKIQNSSFDYCFYSWKCIGLMHGETIISPTSSNNNWAVWTRVWKRAFIGDVRFDENLIVAEDADFIAKLCNGKIHDDTCKKEHIADILYCYYIGRTDNLCALYNTGQIGKYVEQEE